MAAGVPTPKLNYAGEWKTFLPADVAAIGITVRPPPPLPVPAVPCMAPAGTQRPMRLSPPVPYHSFPLRPCALTSRLASAPQNQRETTVVWSKTTGKPLHNAIVWLDLRTAETVTELAASGGVDRFREVCGLPLSTYFSGVKVTRPPARSPAGGLATQLRTCVCIAAHMWVGGRLLIVCVCVYCARGGGGPIQLRWLLKNIPAVKAAADAGKRQAKRRACHLQHPVHHATKFRCRTCWAHRVVRH